nr:hypothetical protein [uncultured Sphaerochaeta sp.]
MTNKQFFMKVSAVSMLIFPVLLLAGFLMHPDILSLQMINSMEGFVSNFHNQSLFHAGHLIVFASVPFIIFALSGLMLIPAEKGKRWLRIGGLAGIMGGVILAGDKGALCIVLSAFDSLSDQEFGQITPALVSIMQRRGLLTIFYLLPLLPLGAAAQIVGLIKNRIVGKIYGALMIVGLLLLNNPDIELISSLGALLMCIGYIPLGIKIFKGEI